MNIQEMMRQAKKLQAKMEQLREEAAKKTVEGTAGGGMVTVTVNGRNEVLSVVIDPAVVDRDELEMLQDLVLAATNQALGRAQEMVEAEMGKLTGGMPMPGLF